MLRRFCLVFIRFSHAGQIALTRVCITHLADLYTAGHAVEPNNGYDTKAEEWRGRLGDSD